jgi:type IV secretion system protein VirD4
MNTPHAASYFQCEEIVPINIDQIAEIVQETFNTLFYAGATLNKRFCLATAFQQEREQEGFDHWDYRYDLLVRWRQHDLFSSALLVCISERQQVGCEYECQLRAKQFLSCCLGLVRHLSNQPPEVAPTTYGSSRWSTEAELDSFGYLSSRTDAIDSKRFICGLAGEAIISIPQREADEHVLVCGPTGSGKSTGIFIPNLIMRPQVCAVVTEVAAGQRKPEVLYSRTAGWRAKNGHEIFYFNPACLGSVRINPLDAIRSDDPDANDPEYSLFFDSASYISNLIMNNTKELSPIEDKIWSQSEQHLLTALLLYAVGLRTEIHMQSQEGDGANLATIRALLRDGPLAIERSIAKSRVAIAGLEYSAFIKTTSPNFRMGVISGVMSRLNPWVNPRVGTITEVTDFSIDVMREQLFTFYFSTLITRPQYRPVAALALNYVIEFLLDHQFAYPATLLLDEFSNYGYIPDIERKLQTIRNQEIGAVIGIQHTEQVRKLYRDDASAILGQPSTRIFFRPRDSASAKLISAQLGPSTLQTREPNGKHTHTSEKSRLLLDESELLRLGKGEIVLFTATANPTLAKAFPPGGFEDLLDLPVPDLPPRRVSETMLALCRRSSTKPPWQKQAQSQINRYKRTVLTKDEKSTTKRSRLSQRNLKQSRFSR